jgi:hypothetical protein
VLAAGSSTRERRSVLGATLAVAAGIGVAAVTYQVHLILI